MKFRRLHPNFHTFLGGWNFSFRGLAAQLAFRCIWGNSPLPGQRDQNSGNRHGKPASSHPMPLSQARKGGTDLKRKVFAQFAKTLRHGSLPRDEWSMRLGLYKLSLEPAGYLMPGYGVTSRCSGTSSHEPEEAYLTHEKFGNGFFVRLRQKGGHPDPSWWRSQSHPNIVYSNNRCKRWSPRRPITKTRLSNISS